MKKFLFNTFYNGLLGKNLVLPFAKDNRFIFLLHDISDERATQHHPVYSTKLKVFRQMVNWIDRHFKVVSLDDLTNEAYRTDYPKNLISIAFDDGFYSVKEFALPILAEKNMPFTIFANQVAIEENWIWCSNILMALNQNDHTYLGNIYEHFKVGKAISFDQFLQDPITFLSDNGYLNDDYTIFEAQKFTKKKIYLDESDLKELRSKGVLIGNHTKTHKHLASCSNAAIDAEILGNKKYLETLLGEDIAHFAIPFGFHTTYNDYAIKTAKAAHSYVYDTEKNRLKPNQKLVPRIGLQNEENSKLFSYVNYPILRNV